METGEGAGGPGGSDGPGLRFGCASFNQDSTSLALGTKTGYKLFSLTMVEKLDCIHESEAPDIYIVERLFSSSLVVVVSTTIPQRMNIYHFKKGTEICNYSYPNNILAVKLNRQTVDLNAGLNPETQQTSTDPQREQRQNWKNAHIQERSLLKGCWAIFEIQHDKPTAGRRSHRIAITTELHQPAYGGRDPTQARVTDSVA